MNSTIQQPRADSTRLEALAAAAGPIPTDSMRLDTLSATGGFIRGTSNGAPAFRIFGTDIWHADLRTAIDDHHPAIARAEKACP